jgi:hypothetical protein
MTTLMQRFGFSCDGYMPSAIIQRPKTPKQCLKCRKTFGSTDKSNRLCHDCNMDNLSVYSPKMQETPT